MTRWVHGHWFGCHLCLPGSSSFPCGETGKAEGTSSELQPSLAIPEIRGKEIHAHPQSVRLTICFLVGAVTLPGQGSVRKGIGDDKETSGEDTLVSCCVLEKVKDGLWRWIDTVATGRSQEEGKQLS